MRQTIIIRLTSIPEHWMLKVIVNNNHLTSKIAFRCGNKVHTVDKEAVCPCGEQINFDLNACNNFFFEELKDGSFWGRMAFGGKQ